MIFTFLERFKLRFIVTLYPTCLIKVHWLPTAFCIILVFKAVLDNLELQLTYSTNELAAIMLVHEQLCHTLAHKLVDTFGKLFGLHRVGILNILEHLGREARQPLEVEFLALGQCITDLEIAGIGQANDIARICLLNCALALCHELGRRRETHILAQTYMTVRSIAHEFT